jgi:hypothetical protein
VRRGRRRLVLLGRGCSLAMVEREILVEGRPIVVVGRIVAVVEIGLEGDLGVDPIVDAAEEGVRRSLVADVDLVVPGVVAILLAVADHLVLASWEGDRLGDRSHRRRTGLVGGRGEGCRTCLFRWR